MSAITTAEAWQIAIGATGIAINIAGFGLLIWQARLLKVQLKETREADIRDRLLRRRQATLDFSTATLEKQQTWRAKLPPDNDLEASKKFALDALTSESSDSNTALQEYLGFFEELATGVNLGVYDIVVVYNLMGNRVTRASRNFGDWIDARRKQLDWDSLYEEFMLLAEGIDTLRGADANGKLHARVDLSDLSRVLPNDPRL